MQKLIFSILLFLVFSTLIKAQHVVVANLKLNVVYIGINNPLEIAIFDYSADDIIVSVENGIIKGENGIYNWKPEKPGLAIITVKINQNGIEKTFEKVKYRVKRIPDPITRVGNHDSGCLGPSDFKAQKGIIAWIDNFDIDAKAKVKNYDVFFVRVGKDPIRIKNYGAKFNEEVLKLINSLKAGDTVYIENVYALNPGDKIPRKINSLVFRIR
jgi:hypothetical protein